MELQEFKQKYHRKMTKYELFRRMVFVIIGAFLFAVGLDMFLVPNQIIDGGIVGISIIVSYLTGWPLGIFLILFNLPFFFVGYKQMGKTFALTTLFAISLMALATTLLHGVKVFTTDELLAAVFGGIIIGIGVGLVIRNGGSMDGTEILSILVNKYTPFSVGETVMFLNLFILGSAGFFFGMDNAMYSLIAYFIAFKMIDLTIEGFEESRAVWIISDEHEDIGDALNSRLGRGVTYLSGEGAYTGEDKKVIFCIITRLEESKLKNIVEDYDRNAFVAVGDIHDVKGGNFKKRNIH